MLVLSRKKGERICIGDYITIEVVSIDEKHQKVELQIDGVVQEAAVKGVDDGKEGGVHLRP